MRKQAGITLIPGVPEGIGAFGSRLAGGSAVAGGVGGFLADKAVLIAALHMLAGNMPVSGTMAEVIGAPVAAGLAGAGTGRLWRALPAAAQQKVLGQLPTFTRAYRGAGDLKSRLMAKLRGKQADAYWDGFMTKCAEEGLTAEEAIKLGQELGDAAAKPVAGSPNKALSPPALLSTATTPGVPDRPKPIAAQAPLGSAGLQAGIGQNAGYGGSPANTPNPAVNQGAPR